jgi:3'-phosphoadenosine 5'-phosphosulfate sulfotransferase (PAPS reductase)/FAD synthetase
MNLTAFDHIVISSSAGKDSQAMLDYVCSLAAKQGVLDRIIVVHADLGRVEWRGAKELAELHAQHYGVRFIAVARSQGNLLDHIRARRMFPSSDARYCTSDHKRDQCAKIVRHLHGRKILSCLGFRNEESDSRRKRRKYSLDRRLSTRTRQVWTWLPIKHWTVAQVWHRIRNSGVPYHYAYDLGMPRLSCCFCIFAPENALLLAGQHNRELLAEYVHVEKEIGHTFRHNFPIARIQERLEAGETAGPVHSWSM